MSFKSLIWGSVNQGRTLKKYESQLDIFIVALNSIKKDVRGPIRKLFVEPSTLQKECSGPNKKIAAKALYPPKNNVQDPIWILFVRPSALQKRKCGA